MRINKKKTYPPVSLKISKKKLKGESKLKMAKEYDFFLKTKTENKKKNQQTIEKNISEINAYLKRFRRTKYYQYRIPYRQTYFNYLKLNTGFRLKYLIQDFVQHYFSVQVEAKVIHVLNAHKNKSYFRLVFPVKKKNKQRIKKIRVKKKREIFLTNKLYFSTSVQNATSNSIKKKFDRTNLLKKLKKKDLFLLSEEKKKNFRLKNYFGRTKKSKEFKTIFKYFIPALMDFSRTLDPQILADIIAKVIHKAKKQT
jgi:hypothetical protein